MAYFDELLQRAITVRNNRAPASNTADLVGGVLVSIVSALQMLLDDKQDELTFDTTPTADSPNPVTSDGIYQALQAIGLSACEKIVNKVTSINAQSTNVQYPTAKLLYDSLQALSQVYAAIQHTHAIADIINLQTELDARQLVSNLVTAITAQSTDQQYPSAKLLYDQLALKANQATTYTKTEVDNLIAAISTLSFQVVASLPVSDIRTDVIYLVPSASAAQANIYDEYIYINNAWECIGSTAIDLSGYEQTVNKVTALTAQSTDVQYPSARCVWQLIIGINAALTNLDARVTALEQGTATIYYIKGTSSKSAGQTENFIVTYIEAGITTVVTERPEVDAQGNWQITYANKKIYDLSSFALNNSTVLTITFNEADDFSECVAIGKSGVYGITRNATALTAITFGQKDDSKLTNIVNAFKGATHLTSIDLSGFTFSQVTDAKGGDAAKGVFGDCVALTYVNMSRATLDRVTQIDGFFGGCAALTSVDLGSATFAAATSAANMFNGCVSLTAIDLSAATFDAVTTINSMFYNCNNAATINLALAAFDKIEDSRGVVRYTNSLTTFIVPENATAIAATAASNITILNFSEAPLNYTSMLKIANWLRDFTGGNAHTVTFKTSAWNALTAAEQSNIDTILSGKNWTRVLA